jgi:hypothetical protein
MQLYSSNSQCCYNKIVEFEQNAIVCNILFSTKCCQTVTIAEFEQTVIFRDLPSTTLVIVIQDLEIGKCHL